MYLNSYTQVGFEPTIFGGLGEFFGTFLQMHLVTLATRKGSGE
jgi:hypothetical protein